MQIIDNKALLLGTTTPQIITSAIKKSAQTSQGVAIHWGIEEARKLVQLGVADVPSPILRDYCWPGRHAPFTHQKDTASFLSLRDRAFCFNEQGTGKTGSVIWASDYLMNLGMIHRVLVLCPLSIMKSAWQMDLFKFAMHRSCEIAYGTPKVRKKAVQAGTEFVVMNYEGLAIVEKEVINGGFDLIVVDEANAYKNAQTARWKTLNRVVKQTNPRIWMLTGTPAAQSPLDAYGLAKLVNPAGCPLYFGQFRDSVMNKITQYKWVPRLNAPSIVHKVLQPAIRYEKKDCLDLPPVTFVNREAPLTPQQRAYYIMLKNQLLFEDQGEAVSAVHAAAKLNKLLQISGGAVYTDEGNILEFDISNRLNAVLEVIEEASHKVLVFVPFTHTIDLLQGKLKQQGITCGVIDGRVSVKERARLVDDFQGTSDPHVLILQPAAAAHGLTLTAANTVVWYSPIASAETYLQANARIDRPGQNNPMTVVNIKGSQVEQHLYSLLQGHIGDHSRVIDLYKAALTD